jgi:hypothetical protein
VLKVFPVGAFVGKVLGERVEDGPDRLFGSDVEKIFHPLSVEGMRRMTARSLQPSIVTRSSKLSCLSSATCFQATQVLLSALAKKLFRVGTMPLGLFFAVDGGAVFNDLVVGFAVIEND